MPLSWRTLSSVRGLSAMWGRARKIAVTSRLLNTGVTAGAAKRRWALSRAVAMAVMP
ncbi:hypothetical protein D3C83_324860 [compost metagenome]